MGNGPGKIDGEFFDVEDVERTLAQLGFFHGVTEHRSQTSGGDENSLARSKVEFEFAHFVRRDSRSEVFTDSDGAQTSTALGPRTQGQDRPQECRQ